MKKEILFRPHHLVCTIGFQGKGYSEKFVKNYEKIVDIIKNNENVKIKIVKGCDDVCAPCPNKDRSNKCINEHRLSKLDSIYLGILDIKIGDILTWKEVKRKLFESISLEKFHGACFMCEWKPYGICENALISFLNGD